MDPVLIQLVDVIRNVFQDGELEVTESTAAADVQGWDSLMHITLILNVERAFGGLRFANAVIASLKTVGDLARLVRRHAEPKASIVAA